MKTTIIPTFLTVLLLGAPASAQQRLPGTTGPATSDEPGEVQRSRRLLVEPGELRPPAAVGSSAGWKAAFWITAATTVGLATGTVISAASLASMEDEKSDLIIIYRRYSGDHSAFSGDDVCMEAEIRGDAADLTALCERGERAFLTNYVLLGLTIAGAVASGVLLYRAYFYRPSSVDQDVESDDGPDTSPTRWMITPSVSAGGAGLGFVLRF